MRKSKEIVEILISKGADIYTKAINSQNLIILFFIKTIDNKERIFHSYKITLLHDAATYGSKEILELLIAKAADINAIDIYS